MDLSISSVTERDVDFMLLEEFASSPDFLRWFVRKTARIRLGEHPFLSAARSVTTSSGESDLEIAVTDPKGNVHYLLIENKVAASFQPRQAERYQERGDMYVTQGECGAYTTVLVAPRHYLGEEPQRFGFHAVLSHEDVRSWFAGRTGIGERAIVKQTLLSAAIDKAERGYQPVEDRPVTEFWRSYWALASRIAPELQMPEPHKKPAAAGFVWFKPDAFPRGVTLVHKLPYGNVDLQFSDMGKSLAVLRQKIHTRLEPGMTVVRANKSGAVRVKAPALETTASFDRQAADAEEGIRAAKRLLAWFVQEAKIL